MWNIVVSQKWQLNLALNVLSTQKFVEMTAKTDFRFQINKYIYLSVGHNTKSYGDDLCTCMFWMVFCLLNPEAPKNKLSMLLLNVYLM